MALQKQLSEFQSATINESEIVQCESDREFQSSEEFQCQDSGRNSLMLQLEEKLKTMESQLQSTKNTMEEERRKHEDEIKSFKDSVQHLQLKLNQTSQVNIEISSLSTIMNHNSG